MGVACDVGVATASGVNDWGVGIFLRKCSSVFDGTGLIREITESKEEFCLGRVRETMKQVLS